MGLTINKGQVRLLQVAVRVAGIRGEFGDGRYRTFLKQFPKSKTKGCEHADELTPEQLDEALAICEAMGFRATGKPETHYRDTVDKQNSRGDGASLAQQFALRHLYRDLGWNDAQFRGEVLHYTKGRCQSELSLSKREAWGLTEAMKAMFIRRTGIKPGNLKQIQASMEAHDGKETG